MKWNAATCTHVDYYPSWYRVLTNHCSLEKWMAWSAVALWEGEGSGAVGNGEGSCLSWLFLMNRQKNPNLQPWETTATAPIKPLPTWGCRALLPSVKADICCHHSAATAPRGAQLLCCRMPQAFLKIFWVDTGVSFTTRQLFFYPTRAQGRNSNLF